MDLPEKNTVFEVQCEPGGTIVSVGRDELGLIDQTQDPVSFTELVCRADLQKADDFLVELELQGVAVVREMGVEAGDRVQSLYFSGVRKEDRLLITGRWPRSDTMRFYDELTQINNEQMNALRAVNKSLQSEIARHSRTSEALQRLSRRLMELRESERRFLARELHDQIGQQLTALKMMLEMVGRVGEEIRADYLNEAQSMVGQLMGQVRQLSLDLRPPMLDDLGLLSALRWLFKRFEEQTQIRVKFRHEGLEGRLREELETAVYRIIQEALNNIARHAEVDEAEVSIGRKEDRLNIRIEDRGKGFDAGANVSDEITGGLTGMQERARLLGGRLRVDSSPGTGTRIFAECPLCFDGGEMHDNGDRGR